MATVQEKIDALVLWVATTILTVTLALLGTPVWSIVLGIENSFGITGDLGMSNLHAVQSVPMEFYGFLVCFEIAMLIRAIFVVWSRTTYETVI